MCPEGDVQPTIVAAIATNVTGGFIQSTLNIADAGGSPRWLIGGLDSFGEQSANICPRQYSQLPDEKHKTYTTA
jgi:hypothetical protein